MHRPSHGTTLFLTLNFRIFGHSRQIFGEFSDIFGKRPKETSVKRTVTGTWYKHCHYKELLLTNSEVTSKVARNKASNSRGKQLLNQQDKKSTSKLCSSTKTVKMLSAKKHIQSLTSDVMTTYGRFIGV